MRRVEEGEILAREHCNVMDDPDTWQTHTLEQLSQHFAAEPDAKAFVLTGSLAAVDVTPDFWSDIDAKIILADQAIERYYASLHENLAGVPGGIQTL
jgi:hypothetical protein